MKDIDVKRLMLVRPRTQCGWGYMWAPLAINLEYIAAFIEKDVEEITIVNQEFDESDITPKIRDFKPDLFGVTMSATEHHSGLALCRAAKKFGIPTAVGGYHPSAIPDQMLANPEVDFVFRGESELTVKEFIKNRGPAGVDGISYRDGDKTVHNNPRKPVEDLDSLPFPARHYRVGNECERWLKEKSGHRDQIHASRGCWGRCTFCCEPSMSHSVQRYRSPENVFREIQEVYKLHHEEETVIIFGDPHFMGNPKLSERLSEMLIEAQMKITFVGMIRADTIAKHPDVVAKMAKAGIIGYCMGIESPNPADLNHTKKGITNQIQYRAVRELRKNHCVAGGTFVIGLLGQTEEEILTFPEYARRLGMINAAFAIATPQAGTEFYRELDEKGLIDVRDWSLYDQMHSVFKHDKIPRDNLEKLLSKCLGRFYALDIFVDDMIEAQYRNAAGRKITLQEAIEHFLARVRFILAAGHQYRTEDGNEHGQAFLRSQINPYTRQRMEKIGIHNMMELGPFLRVFGNQKIMISLSRDGVPFVHYVLKTTRDSVDYLDICAQPHPDATLTFTLDLNDIRKDKAAIAKDMLSGIARRGELTTLIRGGVALLADHLAVSKSGRKTSMMTLPPEYAENGIALSAIEQLPLGKEG